jgi:hypothetical protein
MPFVRIDPLDEGRDVDLHLPVREGRRAVDGDSRRSRVTVGLRLLTGPLARLEGGPGGRHRPEREEHGREDLEQPVLRSTVSA